MENELISWLDEQRELSPADAEAIPLIEVGKPWGMTDQAYERSDGGYFRLIGIRIFGAIKREIDKWRQPMLEEMGGTGIIAIVQEKTHGKILLEAKFEPGNKCKGRILLAPSFQASASNMNQCHGGKKPPLMEILEMEGTETVGERVIKEQLHDGGRFFEKIHDMRVIRITAEEQIAHLLEDNQRWSTVREIDEATVEGLCNIHLRDVLHLLDSATRLSL